MAISLADIKQRAFNKRFFVVLLDTPKGDKLVSVSRSDIQGYKVRKWLPSELTYLDLEKKSFYQTPLCLNNKATAAERSKARERYFKYLKQTRSGK